MNELLLSRFPTISMHMYVCIKYCVYMSVDCAHCADIVLIAVSSSFVFVTYLCQLLHLLRNVDASPGALANVCVCLRVCEGTRQICVQWKPITLSASAFSVLLHAI